MKLAACRLAKRLRLPSPASVDSLLDAAVWRTGVMSQDAVPVDVPEQGQVSDDDSYSDSDSEQ